VIRILAAPLLVTTFLAAQASPPALPDYEAFVRDTRNNLARSQREQFRFAYKERSTELHTNPFGRIGTGDTVVYDVMPSEDGKVITRRLVERNGKPVQNGPVETRNRPQPPAEGATTRRSGLEDSVAMLDFALDHRETVNGRSAIVVTFTPKPDAKPETSQGRIARFFKGSVWVDEESREVVRIEATAVDDISIGAGLIARLNEGTKATLTREQVEGGIWLPTSIRFVGQGRALLFRRLNVDQRIEWFNYRKMN
jgi:hypothetical protein